MKSLYFPSTDSNFVIDKTLSQNFWLEKIKQHLSAHPLSSRKTSWLLGFCFYFKITFIKYLRKFTLFKRLKYFVLIIVLSLFLFIKSIISRTYLTSFILKKYLKYKLMSKNLFHLYYWSKTRKQSIHTDYFYYDL